MSNLVFLLSSKNTEINMRDIAAINICSEGKYAHTGIIVTYCGAHNGSILLTCETPSISHDLVHALRLVHVQFVATILHRHNLPVVGTKGGGARADCSRSGSTRTSQLGECTKQGSK